MSLQFVVPFVLLLVGVTSGHFLHRIPDKSEVMISETVAGIKLECYVNGTSGDHTTSQMSEKITWQMEDEDGTEVEVDMAQFVKVNDDGRSELRLPRKDSKVGMISCKFEDQEQLWEVKPYFKLEKWPQSEVVVEGSDHKLLCKLKSDSLKGIFSDPIFTWYMYSEELSPNPTLEQMSVIGSGTEEITTGDELDIDAHLRIRSERNQSMLKIEDAVYEDRMVYRCVAKLNFTNGETRNATVETLIRVKDRYAALYPFIGIVCEVLALCLLIFLCERRKSADDVDDDDDDGQQNDKGENNFNKDAGNGSNNLRNRKN